MEETEIVKSFWNKTTAELTVKDQLAMVVLAPAALLGGTMVVCGVIAYGDKVVSKFRKKNKIEAETTETTEES